jgi:hypothetical protein
MVTGVCRNEQPSDLEAGEGARVTDDPKARMPRGLAIVVFTL